LLEEERKVDLIIFQLKKGFWSYFSWSSEICLVIIWTNIRKIFSCHE
jgi:hypothetical protein